MWNQAGWVGLAGGDRERGGGQAVTLQLLLSKTFAFEGDIDEEEFQPMWILNHQ